MKYKLKTWAFGSFPEIDMTQELFEALRNSTEILQAAMAIEEKYELIISNFLELEKDCLSISAEYIAITRTPTRV